MLVPWLDTPNVFAEMDALRRQMDALFERSTGFETRGVGAPSGGMHVQQTDDHYLFTFDVPGLESKDVELTCTAGQLSIAAERKIDVPQGATLRHRERRSWRFTRTLQLPDTVDADNVEANLTNGVLTIKLPVRPAAQPRRIEVGTNTTPTPSRVG